jgi:hypothetical protein
MATADSRYTLTLTLRVEEESKNEDPMHNSDVKWSGLNYAGVCAMEALLISILEKTNEWGFHVANEIGQGDELKKMLGGKPDKK